MKFFKNDAAPNAPTMTIAQVQEYQKSLNLGEQHQFQDFKMREMRFDKEKLEGMHTKEQKLKTRLHQMCPSLQFNPAGLMPVACRADFCLASGENAKEQVTQKHRERQFGFGVIYNNSNIPNNPVKEFDEIYIKLNEEKKNIASISLE